MKGRGGRGGTPRVKRLQDLIPSEEDCYRQWSQDQQEVAFGSGQTQTQSCFNVRLGVKDEVRRRSFVMKGYRSKAAGSEWDRKVPELRSVIILDAGILGVGIWKGREHNSKCGES